MQEEPATGHKSFLAILLAIVAGAPQASSAEPVQLQRLREFTVTSEKAAEEIVSVAYSPDGKLLAAGTAFGLIQIWSTGDAKPVARLSVRKQEAFLRTKAFGMVERLEISCLSLSRTGESVAFGTRRAKHWQLAGGGKSFWMALSSDEALAGLWTRGKTSAVGVHRGHKGPINDILLSEDGTAVVTASSDKSVRLWKAGTAEAAATYTRHSEAVRSLAAGPGLSPIVSGGWDRKVVLWDRSSGTGKQLFDVPEKAKYAALALAPDAKTLVAGGDDRVVRLYDVASGKLIRTFKGHSKSVNDVAFTPDGAGAVSAGADGVVILWAVETGQALAISREHKGAVHALAVSPDGTRAVSGGEDKRVIMWQLPKR